MKKRQVKKILSLDKPQDVKKIMAAIKALGQNPTEIAQNLVKLGFEKADQSDPTKCPVCKYLRSIGLKSPYVDVEGVRMNKQSTEKVLWDSPMERFQELAGNGEIVCLGGWRDE